MMRRSWIVFWSSISLCSADVLWQSNDNLWLAGGAISALTGYAYSLKMTSDQAIWSAPNTPWDDPFRGQHNKIAGTASDLLALSFAPLGIDPWLNGKTWQRTLDEDLIYTEVLAYNIALNTWIKSIQFYPRPAFALNGKKSSTPDQLQSFYSMHTSSAFALATSWALLRSDRGDSPWWSYGGFALAGAVGFARIWAGAHYPTDVAVGALVGSGMGYVITSSHLQRDNHLVMTGPTELTYRF